MEEEETQEDSTKKFLDVKRWLENMYGIGKVILRYGEDDWVVIDANELTEERLREFIQGTNRISQIADPVPRK